MDRRAFNKAVLAGTLTGLASNVLGASAQTPGPPADESVDLMMDEMVAETGGMPPITTFGPEEIKKDEALRKDIVTRVGGKLTDLSTALATKSPPPAQSIDAAHLGQDAALSEGEFELNDALLESLASANGFASSFAFAFPKGAPQTDKVLFGLRGCEMADLADAGVFKSSVRLKVSAIDHTHMRCIIGIWDRKAQPKQVAVFRASTVPNLAFVEVYRIYLALRGRITRDEVDSLQSLKEDDKLLDVTTGSNWYSNCLSQGLHIQYIGPHGEKQPNMLRQSDYWYAPVARAKSLLGFTNADWESPTSAPCDDIHAAYDMNAKALIPFQSNGCNVISGTVKDKVYSGQIATFRDLLGLENLGRKQKTIVGASADQKFFYMLLSGREAYLQSQKPGDASLDRIRFGSSGPRVVALRKQLETLGHKTQLKKDPGDIIGCGAVDALRKEQEAVGQAKDGVLSKARATELGLTWT